MNINKRQLKKWIAALDSGEYKQGKDKLNPRDNYYCCLGVACKALIPANKVETEVGRMIGGWPNEQSNAPEWLKRLNDSFYSKTGAFLTDLNDEKGFTFPEIATLLELVYIHKILD